MENKMIEVIGLTKSFNGRTVIDNIDITVDEGDIFGFLGPNGSGKTTTIRMLLKLIYPDSGVIRLVGSDIKEDFSHVVDKVGAIVETPRFYTYLSGRKNLELMANLIGLSSKDRIDEVLKLVGLVDRAKDKFKTYSLGMKQRLGIANALLNDPRLVILDEPTNGLDPQGMKEVRDIILKLSFEKKITFLISTHLLHEVEQICNKVAVLNNGRIVAQGKVSDLLNSEWEIIEVHTSQEDRAFDIVRDKEYVKSVEKIPRGVRVKIEKGNSSRLNSALVKGDVDVQYLIPNSQSLESYFIELINGSEQVD